MKKGIILEIDKRYVTLLTPDGQFLRAHNLASDYQIGQEISFFPVEEEHRRNTGLTRLLTAYKGKTILITGIATMILVAGSLFPVYQRNQVYAYMSIDNESSVEVAVNKDLQVIDIIPYDKQGEAVLENIVDWKNKDLGVVSKKIMNEMETQGFIDQDEIVVGTVYKGERNKKADSNLQKEIAQLKEHVTIDDKTVTVYQATAEERSKAKAQGITAGELKQSSQPKKADDSAIENNTKAEQKKDNKEYQTELPPGQIKKEQLSVPAEPSVDQGQIGVPQQDQGDEKKQPIENKTHKQIPDKQDHISKNGKQQENQTDKPNKKIDKNK